MAQGGCYGVAGGSSLWRWLLQGAFWTMAIMLERFKVVDNFLPGLTGVSTAFFQLSRLMAAHLPDLHKHLQTLGISPGMYVPC